MSAASHANGAVRPIESRLTAGDEIIVGKDVLELLTGAMYVDPLSIYREYVQNAADAIDDAVEAGLYETTLAGTIQVSIDSAARAVIIRDDGIGLPEGAFYKRLTAIGASEKRTRQRRGFRGIGRLAGLAYCQELVFRSRSTESSPVLELRWDVRRMREILRDNNFGGGLRDAVREASTLSIHQHETSAPHFFEVQLRGVVRLKNDILLNKEAVQSYLSQVAPVAFPSDLSFAAEIESHLTAHQTAARAFTVMLGDASITKPFGNSFVPRAAKADSFSELELLEFQALDGSTAAVGWILHHSYLGALPPNRGIGGIRLRKSNIQIGGADLVAPLFPESRFNAWIAGEIHVLDARIVPNGRRDDFEPNTHYYQLQSHLSALAKRLTKKCRQVSAVRTRNARLSQPLEEASKALKILEKSALTPTLARAALDALSLRVKAIAATGNVGQQRTIRNLTRSVEKKNQELASKRKPQSSRGADQRDKALAQVLSCAVELYGLEKGFRLLERIANTD